MIHAIKYCATNYSYEYNSVTFEQHNHVYNVHIRYLTYMGYRCVESLQVLDILPNYPEATQLRPPKQGRGQKSHVQKSTDRRLMDKSPKDKGPKDPGQVRLAFVSWGFCLWDFCPWGFFPWGFRPAFVQTIPIKTFAH